MSENLEHDEKWLATFEFGAFDPNGLVGVLSAKFEARKGIEGRAPALVENCPARIEGSG